MAEQGKILYDKGLNAFKNGDYEHALSFFNQSYKLRKDENSEIFIVRCKKMLGVPVKGETKTNDNKINYQTKENKTDEKNQDCQLIISKKCHYEILGIPKNATEDQIRKAYKKLAVKFHPNKNDSKQAAEAFKKVTHAFSVLSDVEKKTFYDKYGDENEARERYTKTYHRRYDEGDHEEFDIFNLFFGGADNIFGNLRNQQHRMNQQQKMRQQQQRQNTQGANANRNAGNPNYRVFLQLLPLLVLLLVSVLPYLFNSKTNYSFSRDTEFYQKYLTSNGVTYFVNDDFLRKYTTPYDIKTNERYVEKDYLTHLSNRCRGVVQTKRDLETKLVYYGNNVYYRAAIQRDLQNLDLSVCDKYNSFRNRIH